MIEKEPSMEGGAQLPEQFRAFRVEDANPGDVIYLSDNEIIIDPSGTGWIVGNVQLIDTPDEDSPIPAIRDFDGFAVDISAIPARSWLVLTEGEYVIEYEKLLEEYGDVKLIPVIEWITSDRQAKHWRRRYKQRTGGSIRAINSFRAIESTRKKRP